MTPALLPTLPADVMRRIALMTFAAEAVDQREEEVWARLSSVSHTWREALRGARSVGACNGVLSAGWLYMSPQQCWVVRKQSPASGQCLSLTPRVARRRHANC